MGAFDSDSVMDDEPGRAFLPIPGERDTRGRGRYTYTPELGELIADTYAESVGTAGGLWALHYAFPAWFPKPSTVLSWRDQFPAFGRLMKEADRVRARGMLEQAVVIADTGQGQPARLRLQMEARYRLAETLDKSLTASGSNAPQAPPARPGDQPLALPMTNAELEAIVREGRGAAAGEGVGVGEPPA